MLSHALLVGRKMSLQMKKQGAETEAMRTESETDVGKIRYTHATSGRSTVGRTKTLGLPHIHRTPHIHSFIERHATTTE